jgi:hypothetical protein
MVGLLKEHGFKEVDEGVKLIKPNFKVTISECGEIPTIVHYHPNTKELVWTETYFNLDNFKKYLEKEH